MLYWRISFSGSRSDLFSKTGLRSGSDLNSQIRIFFMNQGGARAQGSVHPGLRRGSSPCHLRWTNLILIRIRSDPGIFLLDPGFLVGFESGSLSFFFFSFLSVSLPLSFSQTFSLSLSLKLISIWSSFIIFIYMAAVFLYLFYAFSVSVSLLTSMYLSLYIFIYFVIYFVNLDPLLSLKNLHLRCSRRPLSMGSLSFSILYIFLYFYLVILTLFPSLYIFISSFRRAICLSFNQFFFF